VIDLREARLRSSPSFRLVAFDQLGGRERDAFQSLTEEPDFYGLLSPPPSSALPVKSVSRDAALLFMTLREPGRVPYLLTTLFGGNANERLRQLVLDGVFEVEHEGQFKGGAGALSILGLEKGEEATTRVARLSREAICYAAALEGLSIGELAARLYMYNRVPSTPEIQRKLGDEERVLSYVVGDSRVARQLGARWMREVSGDAWLMWRTRQSTPRLDFKLYVSPTLDSLPAAFSLAVDAFRRVGCARFKIGRTSFGLIRPDKFVAYFPSLEEVREAADLICASASGISAHGVPFTAAIDADGLVSWGMDPPRFEQVLPRQAHQSWRQWLAERIAVYMLTAREAASDDISAFVLNRLALDQIDVTSWTPNLAIWRNRACKDEDVV
jgi:hypothetical protein